MNDAALYRKTHELLRRAKLSRWKVSRRVDGDDHWRLTSPSGALVIIAGRPSLRALLAAEVSFDRIQRAYPSSTAGTAP